MSVEIRVTIPTGDLIKALLSCAPNKVAEASRELSPKQKLRVLEILLSLENFAIAKDNTTSKYGTDLSKFKSGPYWDEETLHNLAKNHGLGQSERKLADTFLSEINDHGEKSIAHLALSVATLYRCHRSGVLTIDELRDYLMHEKKIRGVGTLRRGELVEKLHVFDEALKAQTNSSSS